jgi:hypothetical protein
MNAQYLTNSNGLSSSGPSETVSARGWGWKWGHEGDGNSQVRQLATDLGSNWRRRRDSNPRYAFRAYNGLANRRLQPLGHVSGSGNAYRAAPSRSRLTPARTGGVAPEGRHMRRPAHSRSRARAQEARKPRAPREPRAKARPRSCGYPLGPAQRQDPAQRSYSLLETKPSPVRHRPFARNSGSIRRGSRTRGRVRPAA